MTNSALTTIEIPAAGAYRIDTARSSLSFTTRHFFGLGRVRGTFRIREGHLTVADPVAASSALAVIDAASIDTRNAARDWTVRSGQYLETDRHPDITFASTGLEQAGGQWVLHGTLTVRGHSGPLDIHLGSAVTEGPRLRVRGQCQVDRYAFGVTAMKGMTGRHFDLELDLAAERA